MQSSEGLNVLVTFKTNSYADITLFGDAAVALLKLMGQSGNVPGAILANDVAEALQSLQKSLSEEDTDDGQPTYDNNDDDESNRIALSTRAIPVLELLEAAINSNDNVVWES